MKKQPESKIVASRQRNDLRTTRVISEILEAISADDQDLQEMASGAAALDIINKAQYNRFMNVYINNAMQSLNSLQQFNNLMFNKISKKKNILSAGDYLKSFMKLKELENDHVKMLTELAKTQQFTLSQLEREIIIIFRSIPIELQKYLYETIIGFVVQCPEIQKAMQETNQKVKNQQNQENEQ